jgi:hypothetical protein
VLWLETQIGLAKLIEAAHEESGAGEKDGRERDLDGCRWRIPKLLCKHS